MGTNTTRSDKSSRSKLCYITIGATASFDALVEAALSSSFLYALESAQYTHLLIQHGGKGWSDNFDYQVSDLKQKHGVKLDISGYDFKAEGTLHDMRAAKGHWGGEEGVVISHAGSGTVLEALRIDVALVVVPNTTLLHNHQEEVAEVLEEYGYVVRGHLGNLSDSVIQAEELKKKRKSGPPVNSGVHRKTVGLQNVLDEEMGYLD